jgi:hypothetical protein
VPPCLLIFPPMRRAVHVPLSLLRLIVLTAVISVFRPAASLHSWQPRSGLPCMVLHQPEISVSAIARRGADGSGPATFLAFLTRAARACDPNSAEAGTMRPAWGWNAHAIATARDRREALSKIRLFLICVN